MKKVLSLVLVLTLVLGSFSFAFAAPSDVAGTEYEAAVERLEQLKVLEGYPDGTFKPGNTITRAEFAAVVVRVKGLDAAAQVAKGNTEFTDVLAEHWASGYINIASKMGYVNGMGDGSFVPNDPVTYEQAVTMVMRALNYEATAQSRGGYPFGYLIVANETGLLDAVKGVQGVPAPRGLVAQLVDNALEIPMMVQVGVGLTGQSLWVKSGTQGTDEINLLDDLGFENVAGVVSIVDQKKSTIKLTNEDGNVDLKVAEDFDYFYFEGLTARAWYNENTKNVVLITALNSAKFDAVEKVDVDTIKLVGENKSYDLVDLVSGFTAKDADYAKVVLNSAGKVAFVEYYDLEFIVVEDVEDAIVFDLNKDELDVEDYLIVKDGKTITVDEIELGDILFYDYDNDFAVVYNKSVSGEIERIYEDEVKISGKVYGVSGEALFLDDSVLGVLTETILGQMMDEEEVVEAYFDPAGSIILVEGYRGVEVVDTTSFYGFLANTSKAWVQSGRATINYWTFDVVNQEGKTVKYDLTDNFVRNVKSDGITFVGAGKETFVGGTWDADAFADGNEADMIAKTPVKVTLNEDGNVVKVEKLAVVEADALFKVTAANVTAAGVDYRLQDSTLVFYNNETDNKVIKWGDIDKEITEIKADVELVVSNGRVVAIYAHTDYNSQTATNTSYIGLATRVRKLSSGAYEFTLEAAGKVETFLTTSTSETFTASDIVGKIIEVKVSSTTGKMVTFGTPADYYDEVPGTEVTVTSRSTTAKTITVADSVYELNADAVIYDEDLNVIGLRNLNTDDVIVVYFDGSSTRFVKYILVK
ncbi:MAG: S-layer homology domain-containing protein [Candidatus Dojkabacteria bacterium]